MRKVFCLNTVLLNIHRYGASRFGSGDDDRSDLLDEIFGQGEAPL
jgi:hypothetical protein